MGFALAADPDTVKDFQGVVGHFLAGAVLAALLQRPGHFCDTETAALVVIRMARRHREGFRVALENDFYFATEEIGISQVHHTHGAKDNECRSFGNRDDRIGIEQQIADCPIGKDQSPGQDILALESNRIWRLSPIR